jgi:SAM-dependent methyltransferase
VTEPRRRVAHDSPTYWPDYYRVTADRPSWTTTRRAAEAFGAHPAGAPRLAVDLGCGAGRDSRELLRRGWRVLAMDKTADGLQMLVRLTPREQRARLVTQVADVGVADIPICDLVNANLILPFLVGEAWASAWQRIHAALPVGGRLGAMLFGDRDHDLSAGRGYPR